MKYIKILHKIFDFDQKFEFLTVSVLKIVMSFNFFLFILWCRGISINYIHLKRKLTIQFKLIMSLKVMFERIYY